MTTFSNLPIEDFTYLTIYSGFHLRSGLNVDNH